jgi:hypothetical protein
MVRFLPTYLIRTSSKWTEFYADFENENFHFLLEPLKAGLQSGVSLASSSPLTASFLGREGPICSIILVWYVGSASVLKFVVRSFISKSVPIGSVKWAGGATTSKT